MLSRFVFVVPLFFFVQTAQAVDCKLPSQQCERIERLSAKWKSSPLKSMTVAPASDGAVFEAIGGEKSPEADAAAAKNKSLENDIGSCWYNENENQIQVRQDAYAFSDAGFEQCVAGAFAQSRYTDIEGKWLTQLGEHEAWIIKGGVLTKVSTGSKKIETAAARMLWSSVATRALLETREADEQNRSVASKDPKEAEVRMLLGME